MKLSAPRLLALLSLVGASCRGTTAAPTSAAVADSSQSECHPSTNPCAGGLRCCDMANLGGINDPVAHPPRYQCVGGSSCPAPLP